MLFRLLLLLSLFVISALAANGITGDNRGYAQFPIFVYGDTEFFRQAFEIAAMITDPNKGILGKLFELGMAFLILGAGWSLLRDGDVGGIIKKYAFMLAILGFALYGKSTVYVVDQRVNYNAALYSGSIGSTPIPGLNAGSFVAIGNVPWGLGFLAWASNAIGVGATSVVESIATPVGDNSAKYLAYSSTGFNGQLKAITQIIEKTSLSDKNASDYNDAFLTYFEKCLITNYASVDRAGVMEALKSPGDIISNIKYTNFGSNGEEVVSSGPRDTCKKNYDFISNTNERRKVSEAILQNLQGIITGDIKLLGPSLVDKYHFTANPSSPTTASFNDTLLNLAINKFISKAIDNSAEGSTLNNMRQLTSSLSIANIQQVGLGIGYFIGETLPYIVNFLTAVIYAVFPLMAVVMLMVGLGNGLKILSSYFMGLLSIDLLNPSFALVQGLSNYYLNNNLTKLYSDGMLNPIAFDAIDKYYYEFVTQAGVAGLVGAATAFVLPSVILYGNTKALAALSNSLQNFYRNSIAAQTELAQAVGTGGTVNRTATQQAFLDALNNSQSISGMSRSFVSNPEEFSLGAYSSGFQRGMSQVGTGFATNQFGMGAVGQAAAVSSIMQTASSVATANAAMQSGAISSGYQVSQDFMRGTEASAAKNFSNTMGYGSSITTEQAIAAGRLAGESAARTDSYNALIYKDEDKRENYLGGVTVKAAKDASTLIGIGKSKTHEQAAKEAELLAKGQELAIISDWVSKKSKEDDTELSKEAINAIVSQTMAKNYGEQRLVEQADKMFRKNVGGYSGFIGASLAQSSMQADSLVGAANAYVELGKKADSMLINQAQLGVESAAHQAAGTIRGAGGIHSAAILAGKQAEVQTSISSKMMRSFGVGGLVTAGYASQAAQTKATLDTINKEFGGSVGAYIQQVSTSAVERAGEIKAEIAGKVASGYMSKDGRLSSAARLGISKMAEKNSAATIRTGEVLSQDSRLAEIAQKSIEAAANEAAIKEFERTHSLDSAWRAAQVAAKKQFEVLKRNGVLDARSAEYEVTDFGYDENKAQFRIKTSPKGQVIVGSLAQAIGRGEASMLTGKTGVAFGRQTIRMQGDAMSISVNETEEFRSGMSYGNRQNIEAGIGTDAMSVFTMVAGPIGGLIIGGASAIGVTNKVKQAYGSLFGTEAEKVGKINSSATVGEGAKSVKSGLFEGLKGALIAEGLGWGFEKVAESQLEMGNVRKAAMNSMFANALRAPINSIGAVTLLGVGTAIKGIGLTFGSQTISGLGSKTLEAANKMAVTAAEQGINAIYNIGDIVTGNGVTGMTKTAGLVNLMRVNSLPQSAGAQIVAQTPVVAQQITQPIQTQPIQPIQTQPIQTQPIQTQPIQTQPIQTQPIQTQPQVVVIRPIQSMFSTNSQMLNIGQSVTPQTQDILKHSSNTYDLTRNLNEQILGMKADASMNQWAQEKVNMEMAEKMEEMRELLEKYRKGK